MNICMLESLLRCIFSVLLVAEDAPCKTQHPGLMAFKQDAERRGRTVKGLFHQKVILSFGQPGFRDIRPLYLFGSSCCFESHLPPRGLVSGVRLSTSRRSTCTSPGNEHGGFA